MKNLIKSNKYIFFSIGAVLLCVFSLFKMEYSTDTYIVYTISLAGVGGTMFLNGRFITGLFAYLFHNLGSSVETFYYASFILSVIFMSFAIYNLFCVLKEKMSELTAFLISFVTVFNVCAIEYFLFIEKGTFCFSIFTAILALRFFVGFLKGKRYYIAFSLLFFALSALTYQIIPGIFVCLAVVFIVKYSKSLKEFLLNNLCGMSVYGFGMGLDYVLLKLTQDNKRAGSGINLSNAWKVLSFCTYHYGFIFLYIGALVISLSLFFYVRYKKSGEKPCKSSLIIYLKYLYVILGATAALVAPFLFTNPNEVWLMFRVIYPIGALPGAIMIMQCYKVKRNAECEGSEGKSKKSIIALICICSVLVIFFNVLCFGRLINNEADEKLCLDIYEEIENYEKETGKKITTIAIYYDSQITQRNPYVLMIGDCNVRAFSRFWSDVPIFVTLTGRWFNELDQSKLNQQYKEYFQNQNWDGYCSEQLIFDGSVLHLCIY